MRIPMTIITEAASKPILIFAVAGRRTVLFERIESMGSYNGKSGVLVAEILSLFLKLRILNDAKHIPKRVQHRRNDDPFADILGSMMFGSSEIDKALVLAFAIIDAPISIDIISFSDAIHVRIESQLE